MTIDELVKLFLILLIPAALVAFLFYLAEYHEGHKGD